ncbi:hypothetical protein [Streptomyces sp. NPDC048638]|uniref:hypothetical protein n=1 Tax=Streptomyces sp. NPDC048638 TaxID=3365580 RepID=UPI003719E175
MLDKIGRREASVMLALTVCGAVLIAVAVSVGLSLPFAVAAGLGLLVVLSVTAHFIADLELAYPVTRRGRLRVTVERTRPLLDFTTAALATRNAAGRAWYAADAGDTAALQAAQADLALALTALDEQLPLVEGLGLPTAARSATQLHRELHALAEQYTQPALQSDESRNDALESIASHIDVLFSVTERIQSQERTVNS